MPTNEEIVEQLRKQFAEITKDLQPEVEPAPKYRPEQSRNDQN